MPIVSSLFIYPIKSCAGVALSTMRFDARGPMQDRRYMVVDSQGTFLSLRRNPLMAQIRPVFARGSLVVNAPGMPSLTLRKKPTQPQRRCTVQVWSWTGSALDQGDAAAHWFSRVLGEPCRLVKQDDALARLAPDELHKVGFADAFPLLLTTVESLQELNRRLALPIAMYRFRPNVVLRDCRPFEEDGWAELSGGGIHLRIDKPCERCVATTVDQHTLEKGKEPLATLSRFRKSQGKVLFGENATALATAPLSVGAELDVVRWRTPDLRPTFVGGAP